MKRKISNSSRSREEGLTLIELLVTLAIAAVLGSLAAPSIREFIVKSKMTNVVNEFSGAVLKARNEAVTRNICASMCTSSTAADDTPSCSSSETDWQKGWIVFLNPSCDATNTTPDIADIVVARPGGDGQIHVKNEDASYLQFNARGNPGLAGTRTYEVSYGASNSTEMSQRFGLSICMDAMGRTRSIPRGKTCANYH